MLDKLWDDVVAGPPPETGLDKLRRAAATQPLAINTALATGEASKSMPTTPTTPVTPSSSTPPRGGNVWRSVLHPGSNLATKSLGANLFDRPQPNSPPSMTVSEDEVIERIISEGCGEKIMGAAVAEHGKGAVLAVLHEIQDRHDAAWEVERSLLELHQVFLDMAVVVESQGEKLDDIETHVVNARDYVHTGNKELAQAREYQRGSRKCLCIGIILLLLLILIVIVPIATSLKRS